MQQPVAPPAFRAPRMMGVVGLPEPQTSHVHNTLTQFPAPEQIPKQLVDKYDGLSARHVVGKGAY